MTPCVSLKCVSNYDGVWFRAVVLEIFPEERQALVQYIDYGNQETLAFNKFLLSFKTLLPLDYLSS